MQELLVAILLGEGVKRFIFARLKFFIPQVPVEQKPSTNSKGRTKEWLAVKEGQNSDRVLLGMVAPTHGHQVPLFIGSARALGFYVARIGGPRKKANTTGLSPHFSEKAFVDDSLLTHDSPPIKV